MKPRAGIASRRARIACSIELVCCTINGGELAVLLAGDASRWRLPRETYTGSTPLSRAAEPLIRRTFGRVAHWHEQVGAFSDGGRDDAGEMSVVFAVVVARGTPAPHGAAWHCIAELPARMPRNMRHHIAAAVARLRSRIGDTALAFRFVPERFTLSELQAAYEAVLGRRLHKASFRRALARARLVRPVSSRTAGHAGRPSRLHVLAPPRESRAVSLRFDVPND